MNKLLRGLNETQQKAVLHHNGAMLVNAGAGSGKTRVLVRRIANLVLNYHVSPDSIVALTFTNKATNEMRHRIHKLLGRLTDSIHISTFHAFGRNIMKHEQTKTNMQDFTPIDDSTRIELVREIMAKIMKISIHHVGLRQAKDVLGDISLAKNNLETPHSDHMNMRMQPGELEYQVYDQYEKELNANQETDIDDDIMLPVFLLKKYPTIRDHYQQAFSYINVDEYQDTNKAQYELIRILDGKNNNLFAVGDENQCIYGWRGANVRNIQGFDRDYPLATILGMKANYRSTGNIIGVANSVINNNHRQKHYVANIPVNKMGPKVIRCIASTTRTQAEYVVNQIMNIKHRSHLNYSDFAVLFRKNKQAKMMESELLKHHLHYQLVSNNNFFSQKSVQDILAYLYVINNLHSGQSLHRIINVPKRGITNVTYRRLMDYVDSTRSKLSYVINNIYLVKGISKRGQHAISRFYLQIQKWRRECSGKDASVTNIIYSILRDTGYMKNLNKRLVSTNNLTNKASIRADIDGLKGVIHVAKRFDEKHSDAPVRDRVISLAHFISVSSLPSNVTGINSRSSVGLMSVHASKGLEFPIVFIIGMNAGTFPDKRSNVSSKIPEERRIVYVAMTRAEKKLYLMDVQYNYNWRRPNHLKPSRFLTEANHKYMKCIQVNSHNGKLIIKPIKR